MRLWFVTVLCLLSAPILSASTQAYPVKAFTFQHTMYRNNAKLGTAEMRFEPIAANTWRFRSQSIDTEGLAKLAGANAKDTSILLLKNGQFELLSNHIETKVAFSTRVKTTQLSKDGKTYLYKDRKGEQSTPYQAGAWDQHSLTIALMADLLTQKKAPYVFKVVNRSKIETYTFKKVSTQILDTAIGKLNTVRIDQVRDDDSRKQTRIWFAIEKNYTPVLVQQTNEQGDVIELRILSLN